MEEQKIEFETALLAQQLGFDEFCRSQYYKCGKLTGFTGWDIMNNYNKNSNIHKISHEDHDGNNFNNYESCCTAPTQSVLQKWLREKHNCHVEVRFHSPEDSLITKENLRYCVEVNYYGEKFDIPLTDEEDFLAWDFETYEEALEVGLFEGLKLIREKQ